MKIAQTVIGAVVLLFLLVAFSDVIDSATTEQTVETSQEFTMETGTLDYTVDETADSIDSVEHEGTTLTEDTDYTVDGSTVTIDDAEVTFEDDDTLTVEYTYTEDPQLSGIVGTILNVSVIVIAISAVLYIVKREF